MNKMKPYLAMVSLQFGYSGMYIISMVSFKHGMSHYVLSVYRHVVALVLIAPFALVLERPVLDQNLYNMGMKATSATFGAAMVNVLPAITFVMALIFRLEKVNVRKFQSLAKVIGTGITVTGAMVMTLYKGPILEFLRVNGHHHNSHDESTISTPSEQHWVTGTIMLIASCGGWAGFFILQSFTLKMYPAELSLTAWICLLGILEGGVVTLAMERKMSVWVIGWDSRLLAAVYSPSLHDHHRRSRCYRLGGASPPWKVHIYIYILNVVGAILIVMGLYTVVWGKSKDPVGSTSPLLVDEKSGAHDQLPITAAKVTATTTNGTTEMSKIPTSQIP
ncbi:hypothetical protein FEM48_Zijuj06G0126700 [Ziziphus jujuba var. spinosa]|uniref:WAT1-related protein n=1 Tax=Ziziphus jujuba var. spinosa TaxID=714518 RepID=A0A978V9C2_ZIZJJ|nr:hypothetical protein FEM48_Zijuj06G0126700 [Ziziphus jujuba var. spinosa]